MVSRTICELFGNRIETRIPLAGVIFPEFRKSRSRPGSWTRSRRRHTPRRGRWPWSSCRCGSRSWCYTGCGCACRGWCWAGTSRRHHAHVIDVFFVLPVVRVKVKGCRIRYVSAGFIGDDCDVVTYLVLVRIALKRIKRVTHCHVRRPGNTGIGAKGIEQLRVSIVGSIARVIPNRRRLFDATENVPNQCHLPGLTGSSLILWGALNVNPPSVLRTKMRSLLVPRGCGSGWKITAAAYLVSTH